jgi:hypothetical protein
MGSYVLNLQEVDQTQVALVGRKAQTWASFRGSRPIILHRR